MHPFDDLAVQAQGTIRPLPPDMRSRHTPLFSTRCPLIYYRPMPAIERVTNLLRKAAPYLTLLLFSFIVAEPLARGMGACTDDAALHVFRGVEVERLIRMGHWASRWAPDFAHGFGYPLFNYYAPLTPYVLVAVHALGFSFPVALHIVEFIALFASGLAAFALARELWGEPAGLVAGVGYLSAPYLAFDILFRSALAETFAWIWPPLILWMLYRALTRQSMPWALGAAACYAALVLTHNNLALLASPLIAGFGLLLALEGRSLRVLAQAAAIVLFGLALSAFFWVPAIAERDLVQTELLLVPPVFTYYTNFISPAELFALPQPDDPRLINPSPAKALGLIPALLTLPALLLPLLRRFRDSGAGRIAFFGAALAAYAFMTLAISRPLWDHLPLLPFVQFPWRMLSLAALCASLLAGAGLQWLTARRVVAAGVLAGVLLVANLPWWYPRYCSTMDEQGVADLVRYERGSGTIGTTAKGEFLPRTVHAFPKDESLADAILAGQEPSRVDEALFPLGTLISYESKDPMDTRFSVSSPEAFTLIYRNFHFPGWRVTIDETPAEIRITPDEGLISFDVPSGKHRVRVFFGSTPIRYSASLVSAAAALLLLGLSAREVRKLVRERKAGRANTSPEAAGPGLPLRLALLPAVLLVAKVAWVDKYPNPFRHAKFDGEQVASARYPLRADFAGGISLYGFDLSRTSIVPGESVDVSLYIAVREHTERVFWPSFTLEDTDGTVWSEPDLNVPRWQREPPRTPLWPPAPESYAQWARQVVVLPGTPPGRYSLWATVLDLQTLQPDSYLNEDGNRVAPRIQLGEIEVTRPKAPAGPQEMSGVSPVERSLSESLSLMGFGVGRGEYRPGDVFSIITYWRADQKPRGDERMTLLLRSEDGAEAAEWDLPLIPHFPASEWEAGDLWRAPYSLPFPASLPSGTYRFGVGVGTGTPILLSRVQITAPTHVYDQPLIEVRDDIRFGDVAILVGHTFEPAPAPRLTLVWQPIDAVSAGYSVFVHIEDSTGRVVSQSDAVPAQYDRPTTGWLPDEFIIDPHTFELPGPGEYEVYVGLYEPRSGFRIPPSGRGAKADGRALIGSLKFSP